ncbi:MAG: ATP-dependent helicase [Burkholderiaceae bacterium]
MGATDQNHWHGQADSANQTPLVNRPSLCLNREQQSAAHYGAGRLPSTGPLLVLAGAGTGKTATLSHRVAWLVEQGVAPERLLLLTFSRRAAAEMIRRAGALLTQEAGMPGASTPPGKNPFSLPWAGTFHSVAAQLLRQHASLIGLNPQFTIMDRGNSADLMDWLREQLSLGQSRRRFPRAGTCLAIYSDVTNTGLPLEQVLQLRYPWCESWCAALHKLMGSYVVHKQAQALLDFDDLLLWWRMAMDEPAFAAHQRQRFDHILVDEYQDSNRLQVELLAALRPDGRGLFVVGDDAQSIYSFRGADVDHIYRFCASFSPPASRISLQQNYRSSQCILDTANALIAGSGGPFDKSLVAADGRRGSRPKLVTVFDDAAQSAYLIERILDQREQGTPLREQAVLFRNSHHTDLLEIDLTRHNIPFVKYGGLKFVESAHIKDVAALLKWAMNPRDQLAGFRCLQLVPGIGPSLARAQLQGHAIKGQQGSLPMEPAGFFAGLSQSLPRGVSQSDWRAFTDAMTDLVAQDSQLTDKVASLVRWYAPVLALRYDNPEPRQADLQMLVTISRSFRQLSDLIDSMALDPPNATGGWGDDALHDEDYLILSTVHSAKGQEWQSVYLINVADGNFPNEFSTSDAKGLAEERRLLYVGLTRAREHLELIEPLRYYLTQQPKHGGAHVYGARSRFLDTTVLATLDIKSAESAFNEAAQSHCDEDPRVHANNLANIPNSDGAVATTSPVAERIKALWV